MSVPQARLATCPHVRATPQLFSAQPRLCSGFVMLEGFSSLASAGHARMHIGVCLPESNRRPALVRLLLEGFSSLDAHIISARPSKQPLMVRTFLKVYMELGSYFLFLQEQIKDIIIIICRHWTRTSSHGCRIPGLSLCVVGGATSMPTGSIPPPLHQTP